jgi:hypothetical protein
MTDPGHIDHVMYCKECNKPLAVVVLKGKRNYIPATTNRGHPMMVWSGEITCGNCEAKRTLNNPPRLDTSMPKEATNDNK